MGLNANIQFVNRSFLTDYILKLEFILESWKAELI